MGFRAQKLVFIKAYKIAEYIILFRKSLSYFFLAFLYKHPFEFALHWEINEADWIILD